MKIFYNKFKYQITLFLIIILSASSISSIFAASPTNKYTGTVTPLVTNEFSWGWNDNYRGKVLYTPMPGDILFGPITNIKGDTVRPGDFLIKVNSEYRKSVYLNAMATAKYQAALEEDAASNVNRDSKLIATNAISQLTYDEDINKQKVAYQTLLSNKNSAMMAKSMLSYILFRAQFDCIINTVYCPFGLLAGENNVLQLSQISPMGVQVKLDAGIAKNITDQTPVTIYPLRNDKPVGVFSGNTRNTDEGIIFEVDNYCMMPDSKDAFPIHNFDYVLNFSPNPALNKQLAVPINCLDKDDKGYFVQKALITKGSATNLVKVYVKPANMVRKVTPQKAFQALKNAGELQLHDIVVTKEDAAKVKNNKIELYKRELLFMPGDKVKVVIGQ